jgi:hypothetical protein
MEIRPLLSFSEVWDAAEADDRLFGGIASKIAEKTDKTREKLFAQFITEIPVRDVVLLMEYANPVCTSEYRMIIVTKRSAYHFGQSERGDYFKRRLNLAERDLSEMMICANALSGYRSERVIQDLHVPCVLFVTLYENQHATQMCFSDMPMLGERLVGVSRNPQYPMFKRLCDLLLLAKSEDGTIPGFAHQQL